MSSPDLYMCDAEELQKFLLSSDPFGDVSSANSVDTLQAIAGIHTQNPIEETGSSSLPFYFDHVGGDFRLSSLPPCHQLEILSLYRSNQLHPSQVRPNADCGFNGVEIIKRKGLDSNRGYNEAYFSRSYNGPENFRKYMMQRSCGSDFVSEKQDIGNFHTFSDGWMESPENSFFSGQIRRACSTGDLQSIRASSTRAFSASPMAGETSITIGEANVKVGRCSAEERKEKLLKYRAKRALRNFNKTIKYACRKTLADNRPRIRGRFARNDEVGDTRKVAFLANDDEDDFWAGMHEEEEFYGGQQHGGGAYVTSFGQNQLRYYIS